MTINISKLSPYRTGEISKKSCVKKCPQDWNGERQGGLCSVAAILRDGIAESAMGTCRAWKGFQTRTLLRRSKLRSSLLHWGKVLLLWVWKTVFSHRKFRNFDNLARKIGWKVRRQRYSFIELFARERGLNEHLTFRLADI